MCVFVFLESQVVVCVWRGARREREREREWGSNEKKEKKEREKSSENKKRLLLFLGVLSRVLFCFFSATVSTLLAALFYSAHDGRWRLSGGQGEGRRDKERVE